MHMNIAEKAYERVTTRQLQRAFGAVRGMAICFV
jgi:hypothetical protein